MISRIKQGETDTTETKIIRQEYELFYANKFDNLDEIHKFLKRHKLPKLTQEEIQNLSSTITMKNWNLYL